MLNLGTLQFFLGVNTRALDAARTRIENFGRGVENAQRAANRGIQNNIGQLRKIENTSLKALESVNKMQRAIASAKVTPNTKTSMLEALGRAYNDLTKGIQATGRTADATKLDRNFASFVNKINQMNASLRETERATKAAASASNAFSQQEVRLAGMAEKAKNLEAAMQRASVTMPSSFGPALANLSVQVDTAFNNMKSKLAGGQPLDPAAFRKAAAEYTAQIGNVRREFDRLKTEAKAPALADWQRLQDMMRNLGASALLLNGHLGGMSTRLFALGSLVGGLGVKLGILAAAVVTASASLTTLISGALRTELHLEKTRKGLIAVTGSMAIAESQMTFLRQTAALTGAGFLTLTANYTRWIAASTASGQSMETTQQQFRDIAMATGILGLTAEDTMGVFRAFEQMLSKGQVQAEELRNQLGDRLPGAFAIAAKAMGVTTSELSKLTKEGKVLSADFVPKFIEAMKVAYNIDVTKPIDTLQASLNHASDQVTYFFDAFNRNTKVVQAAKTVLELFTRALGFLERNMDSIIVAAGVVAKAIVAMTAAWVVWIATAKVGTILTLVASLYRMVTAVGLVRAATVAWAAAQTALNVVLVANPIGAVAALLGRLVLAITAAVVGYKTLSSWLGTVNNGFADTSHIQAYIAQQQALGFQVKQTTMELLKQAQALAVTSANRQYAAIDAYNEARQGASFEDHAKSAVIGGLRNTLPFGKVIPNISPEWFNKNKLASTRKEMLDARKEGERYTKMIRELLAINKMPTAINMGGSLAGAGAGAGGGAGGSSAGRQGVEENIDAVERLIGTYSQLQDKIRVMAGGPKFLEHVDTLYEAQQALDGLSSNQLARVDSALRQAGFAAGTLEERMQDLIQATNVSEKSIEAFVSAWEGLDKAAETMDILQAQFDFLAAGGSSGSIEAFQDYADAMNMLKDMDDTALGAIANRLAEFGIAIDPAVAGVQELAVALTKLFGDIRAQEEGIQVLQDYDKEMTNLAKRSAEISLLKKGIAQGLLFEDGSLDIFVEHQMILEQYRLKLEETGISADDLAKKLHAMAVALADSAADEEWIRQVQQAERFRTDLASSLAEGAANIINAFGNIKDAAKQLVNDLFRLFTQKFITQPLFNMFTNVLGNMSFSEGGWVKAASGGYIRGPGTTTSDSIPSLLSDKEFVFNAKAVEKWGVPMLQAMNSGRIPSFSDGGLVGGAGNDNYGGGWGYAPQKVHVTVGVAPGDMFRPYVTKVAQEAAVPVVAAGLSEYNDRLPDRMQEISDDPRKR